MDEMDGAGELFDQIDRQRRGIGVPLTCGPGCSFDEFQGEEQSPLMLDDLMNLHDVGCFRLAIA